MTDPYYTDDRVTLHHGDVLEVLAELPDASADAVVTDPPYGIGFMGHQWDQPGDFGPLSAAHGGSNVSYGGAPHPAMEAGRYDRSSLANQRFQQWCHAWALECLRILKPGGHLVSFGGSRTWHRLAAAVEDAGFEIRDSVAWLYGSGFPKSLNVSKAIDKRPGVIRHAEFAAHLAERRAAAGLSRADVSERVVGARTGACWNWEHHQFPEAKWWPALRDLLDMDDEKWGSVIAEAEREKVGTRTAGRLAVAPGQGADRRAVDLEITKHSTDAARKWQGWGTALKPGFEPIVVGRKPLAGTVAANVLEHGTGALNIDACRIGDASTRRRNTAELGYHGGNISDDYVTGSDSGRWPTNVVLEEGLAAELDEQTGELTSGANPTRRGSDKFRDAYGDFKGQEECTPARGAGSGGASRFFPVFRYEAKADAGERPRVNGVAHPTVKPLDLMRWLVRLVTPPGGTVLEPFAGSGTTVEAALLEGFHCIAIERETKYLPLIEARIARRRDPRRALELAGEDMGLLGLITDQDGDAA
ncbi:site-specific DNA-methyltransferase [Phytoactinopolyspora alkaliphila]|uniref:Site-specific DNA-methyltransferase n=1 Tax=Phytoactinopolyspora alkaliphila TaxID=1783498 RepID=A0A6N9YN93_9ACTN|nr:DNA methyltransferase [Phytoactinopolyspora alkaliphila]NED96463.1 site-specific DNA-methyltransferase [Phytoactinopolyspora alkaliphila]